jgi:hypothetical protein
MLRYCSPCPGADFFRRLLSPHPSAALNKRPPAEPLDLDSETLKLLESELASVRCRLI